MPVLETATTPIRSLRYHLHRSGPSDGKPIFLLHGLMDTGASFAPLAAQLSDDWHLIAPDWRGHGATDAAPQGYWFPDYVADLEALIEAYTKADEPVTLIGHSMGGQVASLYAGLRPARVTQLICLDSLNVPATPPSDMPKRYRQWLDAQASPPQPRTYRDKTQLAERIRRRYPELSAAQINSLTRAWSRPTDDGRIRLVTDPLHQVPFPLGFHPEEAMAIWRQVTAQTLFLDAENSQSARWIDAHTMAQRRACFQQGTQQTVAGCGHMLHLEKPGAVADRVITFLSDWHDSRSRTGL